MLMVSCGCQAMESKLLVGGKNIIDHTNEQQKMLEQKKHEIAEQVTHTVLMFAITGNTKNNTLHLQHPYVLVYNT